MNKLGGALLAIMTGVAIMDKQYMAATAMIFFAMLFLYAEPEKSTKK